MRVKDVDFEPPADHRSPQRRESQGIFEVEDRTVAAFAIMTMCEYVISWWKPDGRLGVRGDRLGVRRARGTDDRLWFSESAALRGFAKEDP